MQGALKMELAHRVGTGQISVACAAYGTILLFQEEEAGNFPSSDHQSVAIWTKLGLAECSRAATPKWEHCWREPSVYFSRFKRRCIEKGGPPAIHDTTLVAAATLVWQNSTFARRRLPQECHDVPRKLAAGDWALHTPPRQTAKRVGRTTPQPCAKCCRSLWHYSRRTDRK